MFMAKTILIVDDSSSLRQVVKMALEGAGYLVLEAGDGAAALAMLDGRTIDMVVCDVNMPRMNGIEFVKASKALPKYKFLPILMLTTESQESKKEEGKAAGARAWMLKPFAPATLLNAIAKLCP
jgi:two-component system chemotaxis response regulator CheY